MGEGNDREDVDHRDVVKCKHYIDQRSCKFKCHKKCLKAYNKIGAEKLSQKMFKCSSVVYQFRPKVIDMILSQPTDVAAKKASLRRINKVKGPIDKRKRRYSDSSSVCHLCLEEVPLAQRNHLLQHCKATCATPAILGDIRDYRVFSNRCFEIAQKKN